MSEHKISILTRDLLEAIADPGNDPNEQIADSGEILIDLWRDVAKRILMLMDTPQTQSDADLIELEVENKQMREAIVRPQTQSEEG